jgi:hypothetical protein
LSIDILSHTTIKEIMSDKKPSHYVDNKRFLEEIKKYKVKIKEAEEKGLVKPSIPSYAGECIMKIAANFSTKSSFINYSWREEMVSDAIENSIMYFDNFDPEKSNNPFGYFTMIMLRAFKRRISKEEKMRYTMYKFFERTMIQTDQSNYLQSEDNNLPSSEMYDNISRFIENFEDKEQKRKDIKNAKKMADEQEKEEIKGLGRLLVNDSEEEKNKPTVISKVA